MDEWHEEFDSEEDRLYEDAVRRIREGVKRSLSFDEAVAAIGVDDPALKADIVDDALKVLIAEMHFAAGRPLAEVAQALRLPLERLERAKREMLRDVEDAAIEQYKTSMGQSGTA